ncbi:MAG: hypothetical protein U0163_13525 [Gemmatimonadaceae bacterium]
MREHARPSTSAALRDQDGGDQPTSSWSRLDVVLLLAERDFSVDVQTMFSATRASRRSAALTDTGRGPGHDPPAPRGPDTSTR